MKPILLLIFFLTIGEIQSQELANQILQDARRKTIRLKSVGVNDSLTLHYITYKSKTIKKYIIQPYLVGADAHKLDSLVFEKRPLIISNHFINNKWIITYKRKSKKDVFIKEYDFNTEKVSKTKNLGKLSFNHTITTPEASYLIKVSRSGKIILTVINEIGNSYTKRLVGKDRTTKIQVRELLFNLYLNNTVLFDYIPSDKYVDIGSISVGHGFINKEGLLLSFDNKRDNTSYLLPLSLENKTDDTYALLKYTNNLEATKQIRSFISDNKLFQFSLNYDEAEINIFDIASGEIKKTFNYNKENFGPYNTYYYKKEAVKPDGKKFFKSFRNLSLLTNYNPTIFIVVNEGVDGEFVLECGHINGATYNYNNFDHMWRMQQQMINPQ